MYIYTVVVTYMCNVCISLYFKSCLEISIAICDQIIVQILQKNKKNHITYHFQLVFCLLLSKYTIYSIPSFLLYHLIDLEQKHGTYSYVMLRRIKNRKEKACVNRKKYMKNLPKIVQFLTERQMLQQLFAYLETHTKSCYIIFKRSIPIFVYSTLSIYS